MTAFERCDRWLTRLAGGLALIGGLGLLVATAITCLSILMRLARRALDTAFDPVTVAGAVPWLSAILGEEELVALAVGFALFAGLPWVTLKRGHVTVDLFARAFGPRLNRLLDLAGDVVIAGLAWLILTRQFELLVPPARPGEDGLGALLLTGDLAGVGARIRTAQETQILGLPLWPGYLVAELCVLVFFLTACFCVWRSARACLRPQLADG